mgnify:CR=1 FL=1|tara:strand:- start:831 stop:1355 length:525 start_codon:yes stop_codon:yes gene_type:complete
MFNSGHIAPQWNIEEFKVLNYKYDTHKDQELLDQYAAVGHKMDSMTLYNYFQPNPFPSVVFDYILPQFELDHVGVAINYFKPGQYLPAHVDLYGKYSAVHKIEDEEITRVILMLEDSTIGQISQICDKTIGKWSAGDWFQWDSEDEHAFYNFSMKDRYAVQLTGTKRQQSLFKG